MRISVLNFRSKLLLAMASIVAVVSVGTLLVTQHRVESSYERMFRRQFERQIDYFTALQETRLENVKEDCLKLARSDRLIDNLKQPAPDAAALYAMADDQLRSVLGDAVPDPKRPINPRTRRPQAAFRRFLDPAGEPILPGNAARSRTQPAFLNRPEVRQRIIVMREALSNDVPQQVGYMIPPREPEPGRFARPGLRPPAPTEEPKDSTPQETILTKVRDPQTGRLLGALIVGFPLPDLVPQIKTNSTSTGNYSDQIQSGLLLDDRLYARSAALSESAAELVTRAVSAKIKASDRPQDDFELQVQGAPYRVFYELLNPGSAFPPAYQVCLYSLQETRRDLRDLRRNILSAGAVAMIAALLLSLAIAHGLSGPIQDLVRGTGEIQRGNFEVRVPVQGRDDIGQLAASFNDMAAGLAQKERYRTILNLVADETIAKKLFEEQITLGGELREVTILFCDIRGFTALSQQLPPAEVVEMLNEHMSALTRVVKQHHGVLDKFVGDLLMAIFGAPVSHGDDASDAVRCGLAILVERERLNRTSRYQLQVGIGIATGKVVAGCMGSAERLNYTVLGERVNLASRLCDAAKPGEALIDEETRTQLGPAASVEALPPMQLAGFAGSVTAYRLIAISPLNSQETT